jgi:hypothetical protein
MTAWQLVLIIMTVVVALGILLVTQMRIGRQREQALRARFPQARVIIPRANFFGQESKGRFQWRGNGTLVVTDQEVFFEKWLPRREVHIPLTSIQAVETPRRFLGKTLGSNPLLKITYRAEGKQTDAVAWFFPEVASVQQLLESRPH